MTGFACVHYHAMIFGESKYVTKTAISLENNAERGPTSRASSVASFVAHFALTVHHILQFELG